MAPDVHGVTGSSPVLSTIWKHHCNSNSPELDAVVFFVFPMCFQCFHALLSAKHLGRENGKRIKSDRKPWKVWKVNYTVRLIISHFALTMRSIPAPFCLASCIRSLRADGSHYKIWYILQLPLWALARSGILFGKALPVSLKQKNDSMTELSYGTCVRENDCVTPSDCR